MRAGDVGTYELAELLSPSLFADERIVVLEAAGEAGKDAAAMIASALPPTCRRARCWWCCTRAADEPRRWPTSCSRLARRYIRARGSPSSSERVDFIRKEFRALRVKVDEETVTAMLDAVGSDVRELAAACSQLVADTGGEVDAAAVRRYHSGKAEVKGFDIADKAVAGDVAGAAEALRWAMMRGEPLVVLADALAEAVHTIGRVGPLSGDPYRLAGQLGMPPWRVQKAQKQARRWSRDTVANAMKVVAELNANVKGAVADADYALESAVRKVAELVADRRPINRDAGLRSC